MNSLLFKSLRHYWRTNLAVVAGVATSVAALSGALLVGESIRSSLGDLVVTRLGSTHFVVSADRFFRDRLASELAFSSTPGGPPDTCPIISLPGVLVREASGQQVHNVNVFGVDDRFWRFHGVPEHAGFDARSALVGGALSRRIGIEPGDALLLRVEITEGIPRESLFGRREDVGRTIRLSCREVLPPERLGEFALRPSQGDVDSIFVPLAELQRDIAEPGRVNAVLISGSFSANDASAIERRLREKWTLDDGGIAINSSPGLGIVSIESSRILLDEPAARAAFEAAADLGLSASGVLTYLANSIRAEGREIPYSVITAANLGQDASTGPAQARPADRPGGGAADRPPIWLTDWAARDLNVKPGADVDIDYFGWRDGGGLVSRAANFRLAGILPIGGPIDATLAPKFPGITEAGRISDWDPPFPIDLHRIRRVDEDFWDRYRATPKAIVPLGIGQELWRNRFGQYTAVRVSLDGPAGSPRSASLRERSAAVRAIGEHMLGSLQPAQLGFSVTAVRALGLDASAGSTDFGEYFTYFSFFLISASILLAGLFFRLGVEQRAREVGTLQAIGFSHRRITGRFLAEGAVLAALGSAAGALGSLAYGTLLVVGLRSWWIGAVGTTRLHLHPSAGPLWIGALSGFAVSVVTIALTLRGMGRTSSRSLLSGALETFEAGRARQRALRIAAFTLATAAGAAAAAARLHAISDEAGFFGTGVLLLAAMLCFTSVVLRRESARTGWTRSRMALAGLAFRNAAHRPGRSVLSIALVAAAAFVIVSVEAFRRDSREASSDLHGGTGGFSLLGTSALPILQDPNTAEGRDALGIPADQAPELASVRWAPFRMQPGDDTSCLNLYAPKEPMILGAPRAFLVMGRFAFQASLGGSELESRNPWTLLESSSPDGAIPVIGDANTIQYVLHLSLGQDIVVRGGRGDSVRLRIVAALRDSVLQGGLVMSESNFLQSFPGVEGYRFFLFEAPAAETSATARALQQRLVDWGLLVESARDRLDRYHRVENTYLSTFQFLGGLGLLLGTVGLSAVLLRNVLERRNELALLRAVGYRGRTLAAVVVFENLLLVTWGLACGGACAAVSVLPALLARGGDVSFRGAGLLFAGVVAVGVMSSSIAARVAFRSPLLSALRSE